MARQERPPQILSRSEEALLRFLNAPFGIVVPILIATLAAMLWTLTQYG